MRAKPVVLVITERTDACAFSDWRRVKPDLHLARGFYDQCAKSIYARHKTMGLIDLQDWEQAEDDDKNEPPPSRRAARAEAPGPRAARGRVLGQISLLESIVARSCTTQVLEPCS